MNGISFTHVQRILCLGAHSDDIEIGAGATVLSLLRKYPEVHVDWIVFAADGARADEARNSADRFLRDAASHDVLIQEFPDGSFPACWSQIKAFFETLKQRPAPDLVLTHRSLDLHQDHRIVGELTWNTFRDHQILEYEIPKYDADLGTPNVFVAVSSDDADRKVDILCDCFASQADKHWFEASTFQALMQLRGLECRSPTHLAEAFHARKLRMD